HQRVAVMQEAVENARPQDLVTEDGPPLGHHLVGGDQETATLVSTRHELKEEVSAASLEWEIAELVDDQTLRLAEKHQAVGELPLGLGSCQRGEERGGAREQHRVTGFDYGAAEGNREVGFADARGAKYEDVFRLREEAPGGELAHEALIHGRLEFEIEVVERFHRGEVRDFQAHRDARALFGVDLLPQHAIEEVEIGRLRTRGLAEDR